MRCPFHKGGNESKPSFSINVDLGIFNCFTCKESGGIPKLLHLLGLSRDQVDAEIKDIKADLEDNRNRLAWKRRAQWRMADPFQAETILDEVTIRPYHLCPTKLVEHGFDPRWLQYMEVGFDRVNNRITYPIRDLYSNLSGVVGGSALAGQWPKYKVYEGRREDPISKRIIPCDYGPEFDEKYPNYQFHNHYHIWNYDRVYPRLFFTKEEDQALIVVEGFKACLWLLQNGYWNTVALMGSSMSDRQFDLLQRLRVNIILFLDNDDAGVKGTIKAGRKLHMINPGVRVAQYPDVDEAQPDDLSLAELGSAITGSMTYPEYVRKRRAS
jgi:DNA primase